MERPIVLLLVVIYIIGAYGVPVFEQLAFLIAFGLVGSLIVAVAWGIVLFLLLMLS